MTTYTFERHYRGPVKALIVDLAGTIIDYGSRAPSGAFIELFRRHDITVTDRQAREPMGMSKRDHIIAITRMPGIAEQCAAKFGGPPTSDHIDQLYAAFIPLQLEILPHFAEPIPEVLRTLDTLKSRGIKIAATTGYNREMMNVVLEAAARHGFTPTTAKCSDDVNTGRPAPWQIYACMHDLNVYPREAVINIGDTLADVEAGLNAGVWSVGVAKTGNMLGLSYPETQALHEDDLAARVATASAKLASAGAHYVVSGVYGIEPVLRDIETRLARGERP